MQIERAELEKENGTERSSLVFSSSKLNLLLTDDDNRKIQVLESIGTSWDGLETAHNSFKPFKSFFVVEQGDSLKESFSKQEMRLALLEQLATRSDTSNPIDNAINVVEDKLEKYPFRSKTYKISDLLNALNRGKGLLKERLSQLERERLEASILAEELRYLEINLEDIRRTQKREEYFQLCLETAELDSRIMKVQQRLLHEAELKRELQALGNLSRFPIAALRKVQELWTKRLARLSDRDRLKDEIKAGETAADALQESFLARAGAIQEFGIEDAQELYGLARILAAANTEVEQLQHDRSQEMRKVKEAGVNFDEIALLRKSILAMKSSDLEEAYRLQSDFKTHKERLSTAVGLSSNVSKQLKLLDNELRTFNAKGQKVFTGLISFVAIFAALLVATLLAKQSTNSVPLIILACICFILLLIGVFVLPQMFFGVKRDLEDRITGMTKEQEIQSEAELNLSAEVANVEKRAEEIAQTYQFKNANEMFKKLQIYANVAGRLKQLDLLDHVLAAREAQVAALCDEANENYFQKIGRKLSLITTSACTGLAGEILLHKEQHREIEKSSSVLDHRRSELRFLEGEINDIDSLLRDFFYKAGLSRPEEMEKSYEEFEQKAQSYHKWDTITVELTRMGKDLAAEILENDLATVLTKLQHRRTDAWARMQDLIVKYPGILSETIDDTEIGRLVQGESSGLDHELQSLESRAVELRQLIRAITINFDEFYPKTQHELEIMERDLRKITHNKEALDLAIKALKQIAQESKSFFAHELKQITEQFFSGLDLEIKELVWDETLNIKIRLKDSDSLMDESELLAHNGRQSRSLSKMISWIPRMILCQYIGRKMQVPLILDEPFFELDDKRFNECMKLLLKNVRSDCQVIILSCQKVRFNWFFQSLAEEEKNLVLLQEFN